MSMPSAAAAALARLQEGNRRFVQDMKSIESMVTSTKRHALVDGQAPFATILSCSDSRVPSELVFDCGLGDLFVVRVAGNVVAPSIVGSVEFAASTFECALVVVMGHQSCGAIGASVSALLGSPPASPNIRDIVERITPSIRELVRPETPREQIIATAVRANVRASANHLRHASRMLEDRVSAGVLWVVGAEYSLETGAVDFFDGA